MSTPSQALEIKLKQEVSTNNSEILSPQQNNPHFFELEYGGKISYVLGTYHTIPYSALHKDVKAIIRKLNSLVLESVHKKISNKNEIEFGIHGPFRSPNEIDYYSRLPSFVKNLFNELVTKCCKRGNWFKAHECKLSFLMYLLSYKLEIEVDGMDYYLSENFNKRKKEIFELDNDTVDELFENEYAKFSEEECCSYLYCFDLVEMEKITFEERRDEEEYFLGEKYVFLIAQEEYNEVIERNLNWIKKIVYNHFSGKSSVLFAFGMAHLYGPLGVLNILENSGFRIRKMNSEGKFISYNCEESSTCSAIQIVEQENNYKLLRSQILNPNHPTISWLYSVQNTSRDAPWNQWEKQYNEEKKESSATGYGPGTLVLYKNKPK